MKLNVRYLLAINSTPSPNPRTIITTNSSHNGDGDDLREDNKIIFTVAIYFFSYCKSTRL